MKKKLYILFLFMLTMMTAVNLHAGSCDSLKKIIPPRLEGGNHLFFSRIEESITLKYGQVEYIPEDTLDCMVNFMISKEGKVKNLSYSLRTPEFLQVELDKIIPKMGQWEPATKKGKPISIMVNAHIRYSISDKKFVLHSGLDDLNYSRIFKYTALKLSLLAVGGTIIYFVVIN